MLWIFQKRSTPTVKVEEQAQPCIEETETLTSCSERREREADNNTDTDKSSASNANVTLEAMDSSGTEPRGNDEAGRVCEPAGGRKPLEFASLCLPISLKPILFS